MSPNEAFRNGRDNNEILIRPSGIWMSDTWYWLFDVKSALLLLDCVRSKRQYFYMIFIFVGVFLSQDQI